MLATSSNNAAQSGVRIQTFVFFDLETTGFIQGTRMPKITEISLVASSRDSLLTEDGSLPRVLHKLTIPLQPQRFIPLEVSQITGLYNDLLEHEKPFDPQIYELLNSFISRLCPPVCFVAHNGNRFDYPILLSALKDIGKTLSEDILCIDSWVAFRALFPKNDSNINKKSTFNETGQVELIMLDDGCDAELAAAVDSQTMSTSFIKIVGTEVPDEKYEMDISSMQRVNETTPTHQINCLTNKILHKDITKIDKPIVKKRLPFTWSRPDNFKLDTIYEHLVGVAPLNSHSAESDCLTLLISVIKIGRSFIHWADLEASPLVRFAKSQ